MHHLCKATLGPEERKQILKLQKCPLEKQMQFAKDIVISKGLGHDLNLPKFLLP